MKTAFYSLNLVWPLFIGRPKKGGDSKHLYRVFFAGHYKLGGGRVL